MGVTEAEALNLIKYARGLDTRDEDNDGVFDESRAWVLGDPLHSRPLPINYGAVGSYNEDNQSIYIAFGSNDGFMHFIKNTESGTPGAESGEEVWAFMPQEVMGELATLEANALGTGHPYLVDGSPTAYVEGRFIDRAIDGEAVYLYFGLRRGGKAYYAMDISDPEAPELMWKITKSGDFSELGYTFSDPVVGMMRDGAAARPIVIFGGGYDKNKDRNVFADELDEDSMDDDEGNALYVVDGETGELIWKATGDTEQNNSDRVFVNEDMHDSIPSRVAAMDSDGDQIIDRIYVGDTGGRVWRADINGEDTGNWTMTLLADLGRHYDATIANDRRFFHPPDIVQHKDNSAYDAVIMGSGNRADPLAEGGAVNNYMYMIKDRAVAVATGSDRDIEHDDLGDVTNTCLEVGSECTANLTYGWKLGLTPGTEMSLASPLTIGGVSYFTTYLSPGSSLEEACGPDEGSGRIYAVRLENAAAVRNYDTTTDALERYDELDSQGIPAEAISLPPDGILKPDLSIEKTDVTTRLRTFWLEAEDGSL
jgi:type IV pilus assembly protein PilY1